MGRAKKGQLKDVAVDDLLAGIFKATASYNAFTCPSYQLISRLHWTKQNLILQR
jgi:hypothetical protein